MIRGAPMKRRTRLRSKPAKPKARAPQPEPEWRKAMRADRLSRKSAYDAAVHALQWGAEYTTEYLSGWREPCPLCGLWRPPFRRHHLTRKGNGGTAEDLLLLCWKCHEHYVHSPRPASAPPLEEESRLRPIADHLAAAGRQLGYLPAEQCDICKRWHSPKYMVDVLETGKPARRGCTKTCVLDQLP